MTTSIVVEIVNFGAIEIIGHAKLRSILDIYSLVVVPVEITNRCLLLSSQVLFF